MPALHASPYRGLRHLLALGCYERSLDRKSFEGDNPRVLAYHPMSQNPGRLGKLFSRILDPAVLRSTARLAHRDTVAKMLLILGRGTAGRPIEKRNRTPAIMPRNVPLLLVVPAAQPFGVMLPAAVFANRTIGRTDHHPRDADAVPVGFCDGVHSRITR